MATHRIALAATLWTTFAIGGVACATSEVTPDEPDVPTDGAPPVSADATGDRTKPPGDTSVVDTAVPPKDSQPDTRDSAIPTDAPPDVGADAGVTPYPGDPFDPLAPKEGAACPPGTPPNALLERRCGKCGTQKAFCEAGNIVGTYGPCLGEKTLANSCLPAAREILVCGLCGAQIRRCDAACTWVEGACTGEVASGCIAGEVKHIEGLCADPNEVRRQECSNVCTPGPASPCGPQQADNLIASQVAGTTVSALFNTSGTTRTLQRLVAGACPTTLSTATSFHYTRVVNPGADSVNVTLTNVVPPGATKLDVIMGCYLGATDIPAPANRTACNAQVLDTPEALTFNVAAGGSAIVYTGAVAANKAGRLKLELKTNFVGAEPPPALDHDVVLSENPGETVTEPVSFVTTQTSLRLSVGTCPRTLLTTLTPHRYIRVTNPSVEPLVVDLSLATGFNTTLAAYRGLAAPPISTERNACVGPVNDACGTAVAGADSCLSNFAMAPGESVYLLAQATANTAGSTTFSATTK